MVLCKGNQPQKTQDQPSKVGNWTLGLTFAFHVFFFGSSMSFLFFPRCFPCFSVFLHFPVLHFRLPSGKRLRKTMENHHFSWENSLFLWPFSIVMLVYQRLRFSPNPSTFSPRFPMAQRPTATTHRNDPPQRPTTTSETSEFCRVIEGPAPNFLVRSRVMLRLEFSGGLWAFLGILWFLWWFVVVNGD